jgi:hypothetical protein
LRNDLPRTADTTPALKPPPIIPPPVRKPLPPVSQVESAKPSKPFQTVYVLKVMPEYRYGRSRLIVELTSADNKKVMPKLKLKPGMLVKITVMREPIDPKAKASGGSDAKA